MDITVLPGQGLLLHGQPDSVTAARATARQHLVDAGVDAWTAEVATEQARCARTWWAGPDVGFCGPEHPDARPVTVVHVDPDALTQLQPPTPTPRRRPAPDPEV